jgi:hypothetical protein
MALADNIDEFIKKANKIHNFKYDYSHFIYVNNLTKGLLFVKNMGILNKCLAIILVVKDVHYVLFPKENEQLKIF